MTTDINTKFITLIGTPLSQSFSARMQNRAYEAAGLNMHYFYTETGTEHLEEIIKAIKYMPSFCGAAVTKPCKVEVMKYLDETDELCAKFGSCNTIVKTPEGRLRGFNTDGIGFYESIKRELGFNPEGKRFFCFGAGGAGRAVCSTLALYGAEKIYIVSRGFSSASALADEICGRIAPVAEAVRKDDYSKLAQCGMVINASGLGMENPDETPLPREYINPSAVYFDACYNPARTRFLLDAEAAGAATLNGLGMCLYQAVAQIELWSGKQAPVEIMREELLKITGE